MYKHYEKNLLGIDYVVGDLHGMYSLLEKVLAALGFNPEVDRLFSVGDLVDRGAESHRVLEFLEKPWFHPVLGNHDEMAIGYTQGKCNVNLYKTNGGTWFINLPLEQREKIAKELGKLPVAIDVDTSNGLVGVVHADCPFESWTDFTTALQSGFPSKGMVEIALWDRYRLQNHYVGGVEDVWRMYVGHTPVSSPVLLGNVMAIDTGAVYGNSLTVMKLTG